MQTKIIIQGCREEWSVIVHQGQCVCHGIHGTEAVGIRYKDLYSIHFEYISCSSQNKMVLGSPQVFYERVALPFLYGVSHLVLGK